MTGFEWFLLIVVVVLIVSQFVQGLLLVHLLRQYGSLLSRTDESIDIEDDATIPRIGDAAPKFSAISESGLQVTSEELLGVGIPTVLYFWEPSCGPCRSFLPSLAQFQRDHAHEVQIVAIRSDQNSQSNDNQLVALHAPLSLIQHENTVSGQYGVIGTPSAIAIDSDGKIMSAMAKGADNIRTLIAAQLQNP